jgi:hypothetical protein
MVRVLVFGRAIPAQPDRSTGQQLVWGFQEAGHEAVFCGNFYNEPYRWLGVHEATNESFDLIIISEHNDGCPGYHDKLRLLNLKDTPILYQDYDVSYHPERSLQVAASYHADGYLVGNRYYVDKFADRFEKPALHLPYACSPKIHRKLDGVDKGYLLGFVGQLTDERKKLIEMATRAADNMADIHHAEGIFGEALIEQTNRYRVMFHNNQDACKGLVPGRPWETTGCGTTLLMDRTSYDDFTALLPESYHHDIFVYDNEDDIRKWLGANTRANRKESHLELAGESLMNYVHKNHSYKNRAEEIIIWTKEQKILGQKS